MNYLDNLWRCCSPFFFFLLYILPTRRHYFTDALVFESNSYRSIPDHTSASLQLVDQEVYHLASAILDILQSLDCSSISFTSQRECLQLQARNSSEMSFYLARTVPRQRYRSVLPDESLQRDRPHDAVIALDPFPTANFGHLVVIFSLDLDVTFEDCHGRGKWYIGKFCMYFL